MTWSLPNESWSNWYKTIVAIIKNSIGLRIVLVALVIAVAGTIGLILGNLFLAEVCLMSAALLLVYGSLIATFEG